MDNIKTNKINETKIMTHSSNAFATSTLEGVGGQHHAMAALPPPPRKILPIVHEAGWASGPVWSGTEYLAHAGFRYIL
jgi:hypothetical protein